MLKTLADKILEIRPNAEFVVVGEVYEGIEWRDQVQTKPTKEELGL